MPHIPPPLVALGAAAAQRALSGAVPPPSTRRKAVATTVSLVSLSMAGDAASRFIRRGTTLEPFQPERASVLITSGANTISRNPMYVGMAGLLLAHAVWRGSWIAVLPLAGFVVFIDRMQIQGEEAALLENFGAEYDAFRAATPRWIDQRSLGLR